MAKHITKSVIEGIAYEIKRVAIIVHEYKNGTLPEGTLEDYDGIDLSDPEVAIDWIIDNLSDCFAEHDPTYDMTRFRQQVAYKVNM